MTLVRLRPINSTYFKGTFLALIDAVQTIKL